MSLQKSVNVRNAELDAIEAAIGTAPQLRYYSGSMPVDCVTAASGTLLATLTLPSDWLSAAASGVKSKLGTWSGAGSAAGSAGYYRVYDSTGTTCHLQGTITGAAVVIATNALTAANGNVLNFASTTGVVVGMNISGTGIPANATVLAVTGTTVTMSVASTAGVANAASISFLGDMTLDNIVIANLQAIAVNSYSLTAGNA